MNAVQTQVSDGTLVTLAVGLEYFKQSDISVYLDMSDTPLAVGVDYQWASATSIQFLNGPIANGVRVTLKRHTAIDEMLNIYDGGAPFSRDTLDENFEQLLFLAQESSEGIGLAKQGQNLDMNGYRVVNIGTPLNPQDAATKKYIDDAVIALIESGQGPQVDASDVFYITPQATLGNLQDLSGAGGADLIGYGSGTIADALDLLNNPRIIRPEEFGAAGQGNAAVDTQCLRDACAAMVDNSVLECRGNYLISGSTCVIPSRQNIVLDLRGATFRQQTNFSSTINVTAPNGMFVEGGRFYGRGGAAGEFNGASSSYNGVAAIRVDGGDAVYFKSVTGRDHAGGCLVCFGVLRKTFDSCDIKGIGSAYIDPVGQGNQGNGSDFAIMCQHIGGPVDWVYEDTFINNRLRDHAFGIQSIMTKVCRLLGNNIGPCPGQHGIYGVENDGLQVVGNTFTKCFQVGVKTQLENYAGTVVGPAWKPSTAYTVGQSVRAFSNLWICKTAHTSGGAFTSTNWDVDPRMQRRRTVVHSNTFVQCGYDIGITVAPQAEAYGTWNEGPSIKGNASTGCVNNSLYLDRCLNSVVEGNTVDSADYGLTSRDFSGSIRGNVFKNTKRNAVLASLYGTTVLDGNQFWNCALLGTADDSKCPVVFYVQQAGGLPNRPGARAAWFRNNGFLFPSGTAAGPWLFYDSDTGDHWSIVETWGTTTSKLFRVDGGVTERFRNHFQNAGFVNTAQNAPTFDLRNWSTNYTFDANGVTTDLMDVVATLMSTLGGLNVIRKTG